MKQKVPGCVTINFEEADKDGGIVKAIAQEVEHGPTVAIEAAGEAAVGMEAPGAFMQSAQAYHSSKSAWCWAASADAHLQHYATVQPFRPQVRQQTMCSATSSGGFCRVPLQTTAGCSEQELAGCHPAALCCARPLVLCVISFAQALRVVWLAAGFHYAKSLSQKAQMALGLATDPSDMLNEMIQVQ